MNRTGNRQAGFSPVEVVAAIGVVIVLGTAGWVVYQHNRTRVTHAAGGAQKTNQTKNQQTTTGTTSNQNIVKISELGMTCSPSV